MSSGLDRVHRGQVHFDVLVLGPFLPFDLEAGLRATGDMVKESSNVVKSTTPSEAVALLLAVPS